MMPAMFIYFLKVNFLLLVFTAAYWLLLRRGKLLQLNRAILIAITLLAFLLPVLPVANYLGQNIPAPVLELASRPAASLPELIPPLNSETSGPSVINTAAASQPSPAPNHLRMFALWVFFGVAGFLLFLLVRQFVHIFGLILYSTNTRENGLTIVHTEEDVPPFSFFRFLVLNPAKYAGEELLRIIVHEKVHIRQHHYLDILLGEFLRVLCWCNPAAWGLNALLKMNLEYIADREVLSAGVDRKNYQYQLLHMGVRGQSLRLTTPLNYSPVKMRISMMNAKKSGVLAQLRYVLLLPVLLLAAMVITPSPTLAQKTQEATAPPAAVTIDSNGVMRGPARVNYSDSVPGSIGVKKELAAVNEGKTSSGSESIIAGIAKVNDGKTISGSGRISEGLATVNTGTTISGSGRVSEGLATVNTGTTPGSEAGGSDIYFVIRPTTTRKTLLDAQEILAEKGIKVKYDNLNYNDGLLTAITITITTADFSGNLSYDPLETRLVFYDLRMSDRMTGFEYGTPQRFKRKQLDDIDGLSGLLIKKAGGGVTIRGTAKVE